jgi:hypothetical protein
MSLAKRTLFYLIALGAIVLLSHICAHSAPFLVVDPPSEADAENIHHYEIVGIGPEENIRVEMPHPTGMHGNVPVGMLHDVSDIEAGGYTVRVRACTELWGCSEYSDPFTFTRPLPLSAPQVLNLVP